MIDLTQTFMYCIFTTLHDNILFLLFSHCIDGVAGCTRMLCRKSFIFSLSFITHSLSLFLSFSLAPCVVNGVTHASGTSFTAPDGCNTW